MREPLLKSEAHACVSFHEVARLQQQIEKVERTRARLQLLVPINRAPQFALKRRREIGVRVEAELFEAHA